MSIKDNFQPDTPSMELFGLDPELTEDIVFWESTTPKSTQCNPTVDIENKLFGTLLSSSLQTRGGVDPNSDTYFSDLGETRGD